MFSIINSNPLVKRTAQVLPILSSLSALWYWRKRQNILSDPLCKMALQVLQADRRVTDFGGETIKPGWIVNLKEDEKEGTKTFMFNISGASGKLKTTVITDNAKHGSLKIWNSELLEYQEKKSSPDYNAKDFEDNWPIDFEEYWIGPSPNNADSQQDNRQSYIKKLEAISNQDINDDDKIWRIKNLRVAVDDDTRILLLPLPESKRTKKLVDTRYQFNTYQDLLNKYNEIQEEYEDKTKEEVKRYEDKTQEEIEEDIRHKRRRQFQTMTSIRKYQFGTIMFGAMFYLFLWKHVSPKPVMNSLVYNNALDIMKKSLVFNNKVGESYQITNCQGWYWPFSKTISFDLTVYGDNDQAKIKVKSVYKEKDEVWLIDEMLILTQSDLKGVKI